MTTYATCPKAQAWDGGCKVSWSYYDKREDADAASKAAQHDAEIQLSLGYDFGFCCPGDIRWVEAGTKFGGDSGRWEVCMP